MTEPKVKKPRKKMILKIPDFTQEDRPFSRVPGAVRFAAAVRAMCSFVLFHSGTLPQPIVDTINQDIDWRSRCVLMRLSRVRPVSKDEVRKECKSVCIRISMKAKKEFTTCLRATTGFREAKEAWCPPPRSHADNCRKYQQRHSMAECDLQIGQDHQSSPLSSCATTSSTSSSNAPNTLPI